MGLCKCPQRKVTNIFCYEHRVNVCEHCLMQNHPKVIIGVNYKFSAFKKISLCNLLTNFSLEVCGRYLPELDNRLSFLPEMFFM